MKKINGSQVISSNEDGSVIGVDQERDPKFNGSKKTRYSKEELNEFKEIILEKITRDKIFLESEKDLILNKNGTSNDHYHVNDNDQGPLTISKEKKGQDIYRIRRHLSDLQQALVRIEDGSYGVCRKTGDLISKSRLRAVPHATLSIRAKNQQYGTSIGEHRQ